MHWSRNGTEPAGVPELLTSKDLQAGAKVAFFPACMFSLAWFAEQFCALFCWRIEFKGVNAGCTCVCGMCTCGCLQTHMRVHMHAHAHTKGMKECEDGGFQARVAQKGGNSKSLYVYCVLVQAVDPCTAQVQQV